MIDETRLDPALASVVLSAREAAALVEAKEEAQGEPDELLDGDNEGTTVVYKVPWFWRGNINPPNPMFREDHVPTLYENFGVVLVPTDIAEALFATEVDRAGPAANKWYRELPVFARDWKECNVGLGDVAEALAYNLQAMGVLETAEMAGYARKFWSTGAGFEQGLELSRSLESTIFLLQHFRVYSSRHRRISAYDFESPYDLFRTIVSLVNSGDVTIDDILGLWECAAFVLDMVMSGCTLSQVIEQAPYVRDNLETYEAGVPLADIFA